MGLHDYLNYNTINRLQNVTYYKMKFRKLYVYLVTLNPNMTNAATWKENIGFHLVTYGSA